MPDRPESLLSELRRRGVIRTGAVFLAGAWLAIEVADTVFPRLGLPDWGVTALVWSAVLGFPAVIALAWVFDLGPGGLRRDRIVRSPRALVPALVVLTAVLGLGAWVAWLRPDRMAAVPLDEGLSPLPPPA